jgi:hypothetical protein
MQTAMKKEIKERPILFSGPMVKAILEGRKTQTRRVMKDPELPHVLNDEEVRAECPYGKRGDHLWVRETWRVFGGREYEYQQHKPSVEYRADETGFEQKEWRPSIFMPRWASRITLEITNVRVERLQNISFDDCLAEGIPIGEKWISIEAMDRHYPPNQDGLTDEQMLDQSWTAYVKAIYEELWDKINGKKHPWESNPRVWVIEFKPKTQPERTDANPG